jgi:hypothetical protein
MDAALIVANQVMSASHVESPRIMFNSVFHGVFHGVRSRGARVPGAAFQRGAI